MERAEAEAIYEQGREVVVAVLVALSERVAAQDAQIAKLSARVEDLERRLNRNSRNSSLPPKRAPSSGRSQGAQPGHRGHGRPLQPIESVDALIDHWPERCGCGHRFSEAEREPVGEPARHQVAELPPIAVLLSEHRLQRLRCPDCGACTRAELSPALAKGAFGPRLEAAIATLSVPEAPLARQDRTQLHLFLA
jgi:transposase